MSAYPTKISICGHTVQIVIEDNAETLGETRVEDMTIMVSQDACNSGRFESVLLHETIHFIIRLSGLDTLIPYKKEEALVSALEYGLITCYRRRSR